MSINNVISKSYFEEGKTLPRQLNNRWSSMNEVAKYAGVSKITVSRVLSDPELVSLKTREKVNKAISALGYIPEAAARALSSGKSQIVAANISTLSGSIFMPTINRLSQILSDNGIQLFLSNSEYSEDLEKEQLSALVSQRPLGLVITNSIKKNEIRKLLSSINCTIVEIWDLPEDPIDCAIGFSNYEAGKSMSRFLYDDANYKKIAFLGSSKFLSDRSDMRLKGFIDFHLNQGIKPHYIQLEPSQKGNIHDGAKGFNIIMNKWPDIEAIFCSGDVLAIGAICEARRKGLGVPEEIAIAGFGNIEFGNDYGIGLTTVEVRGDLIGAHAAKIIIDNSKLKKENKKKIIDVGFEIKKRNTT